MQDDLQHLKALLKRKRTDTLLSREVGVGLLAAAGVAVTPWTLPSGLLAVGALKKAANSYKAERRDALSKHAMSWLFTLSQRGPIKWY
jgi:hypothetical protein